MFGLGSLFCGPPKPRDLPTQAPDVGEILPGPEDVRAGLRSRIWNIRSQAILDVRRANYRKLIPELYRLLEKDENQAVRETAALVLADFDEQKAGPLIARMLKKGKDISPDFLMEALERLRFKAGAYAVLPYLNSENHIYRLRAVATLAAMQAKGQGGKILSMAKKNRSPEKAKTYAMALGKLGYRGAESYLQELARTSEPGPTLAASYLALGRVRASTAGSLSILARALHADFSRGRENSAEALVLIKNPRALEKVYPTLEHDREESRYLAAKVIAGIPDPKSGPLVLALLEKNKPKLIGPAAFVLGRLRYEPARGKLEELLKNPGTVDRERLARSFGWLGGQASVQLLIAVLQEDSGEGRYGAAWSLGILEAKEALKPLIKAAASSDRRLMAAAVEALGSLKSPEALGVLQRVVESDATLRVAALESISDIPGERARKLLEEYARHENFKIAKRALLGLAKRKDPASIPVLIELVKSGPAETIKATYVALAAITGKRYTTRNEWINWFNAK